MLLDMNSRYLDYNLYGKGFSRDSEQVHNSLLLISIINRLHSFSYWYLIPIFLLLFNSEKTGRMLHRSYGQVMIEILPGELKIYIADK